MRWYGILGGLRPPRPPAGGAAPPRTPLHILRGLRPLKLPLRVFGRAGSQNPIPSILTNAFRSKLVTRDILTIVFSKPNSHVHPSSEIVV